MMRQLAKYMMASAIAMLSLGGCTKQELPYFEGENTANFWIHSIDHSLLGATTDELPQDTIVVNIALSGRMADYDRPVRGVAVPDAPSTPEEQRRTTASPEHYEILGGMIPANELYGEFKILVKNPPMLGEIPDLKLRVEIVENEHFALGLRENNYINLSWSRAVLRPATWSSMRSYFCAVYSTRVYRIIMEVTGMRELPPSNVLSAAEARGLGRLFGERVRELSAQQGSPLLHDDGPNAGLPIEPIY